MALQGLAQEHKRRPGLFAQTWFSYLYRGTPVCTCGSGGKARLRAKPPRPVRNLQAFTAPRPEQKRHNAAAGRPRYQRGRPVRRYMESEMRNTQLSFSKRWVWICWNRFQTGVFHRRRAAVLCPSGGRRPVEKERDKASSLRLPQDGRLMPRGRPRRPS